jgi:hypothetical protein
VKQKMRPEYGIIEENRYITVQKKEPARQNMALPVRIAFTGV